jgi:hypothetical protein
MNSLLGLDNDASYICSFHIVLRAVSGRFVWLLYVVVWIKPHLERIPADKGETLIILPIELSIDSGV